MTTIITKYNLVRIRSMAYFVKSCSKLRRSLLLFLSGVKKVSQTSRSNMFTKSWASLALLLIVQTIGLGLFAKGFFPHKTILPGFASLNDIPSLPEHGNATPKPSFDRLVFMLIDALRR